MKKAIGVILLLLFLFVGYQYLNFRYKENMLAEQKALDDEQSAYIAKIENACKTAISSAVSPRRVLDFSYNYGRYSSDYGGWGRTDTGYSYRVIADLGGEQLRLKCYLDKDFNVLQVTRDQQVN